MEHLDLAGVIATPNHWTMPAFDQQDAIYLSSSRQMLEPILEETSEDEEHAQNSWSQYDNGATFWSSAESETGSVIRIEVNKDADAVSERDFACPPKRARRSEEFLIGGALTQQAGNNNITQNSLDDTVILRRPQRGLSGYGYDLENSNSLERFLSYETAANNPRDSLGASGAGGVPQRSSTGSRRFDEFYSDSDSYNSLSRSSSLIQFESLERQLLLQEQHASMSSLGNSSPSLLSFDGTANANSTEDNSRNSTNSGYSSGSNSRRGSQSSLLKRFESSDGRLHQTYFELDKLNFDDEAASAHQRVLFGAGKSLTSGLTEATVGEVKSDSESSTASSGNSILNASKPSAEDLSDCASVKFTRLSAYQRGGKNSAENLSEDSGYCEPAILRKAKSKSLPKNFEKFCEEEEEYQQHDDISQNTSTHSKYNASHYHPFHQDAAVDEDEDEDGDNICQPKTPKINDATFIVESNESSFSEMPPTPGTPATPASPISPFMCYERVINSPPRESVATYEQRRSMAHSPSPAASDASSASHSSSNSGRSTRSSTSASTCASAASFTWLPKQAIHRQKPPQQQQQLSATNQPKQSLGIFGSSLRNSLPDIRDAFGTYEPEKYNAFEDYRSGEVSINGDVLERPQEQTATTATTPIEEDSDISSSSPFAHDSRSDATDAETTPETKKRVGRDYRGRGGSGEERCISSVPIELNKLGRKKRSAKYSKSSTAVYSRRISCSSADEEEEDADNFFDVASLKIRRSCSWSERRERTLHKKKSEEASDASDAELPQPKLLGYMNKSYQNLTLLDYSGEQDAENEQQRANSKRSAEYLDEMDKMNRGDKVDNVCQLKACNSTSDYERIICKGNFLLDELSAIYDRNASILNDQPAEKLSIETLTLKCSDSDEAASSSPSPLPPPRQRKHSNSSYADLDGYEPEVQHVQLTIRKPPARQKCNRNSDVTNSLHAEETHSFSTFGKTFDQDPTNLRTSYAQSLEKCNFDAKEVSNSDLSQARSIPKRRFHTQVVTHKKRNLVSSTPNLNAFDPRADEMEDDIYVSSAHTSMHRLPQTQQQKPLGILLPVGSRQSFSKEVSFCPVVSKYSWQEQSSDEHEPTSPETEAPGDDDTDDELLDNADATVIQNTKENETIGLRFNEESVGEKSVLRETTPVEKLRAPLLTEDHAVSGEEKTSHAANVSVNEETQAAAATVKTSHELVSQPPAAAVTTNTALASQVSLKTTLDVDASSTSPKSVSDKQDNTAIIKTRPEPKNAAQRPFSLQLPILSEPPTNRAHHILYASQQLLDRMQHREREDEIIESVNNSSERQKMSKSVKKHSEIEGKPNNNNEVMKSKFKADEKHPNSKGFLQRFANGFRFSLRRNKKKQLQQQKDQQQQVQQPTQQNAPVVTTKSFGVQSNGLKNAGKQQTPDFIYIPLKGPLPAGSRAVQNNTSASVGNATQHDSGINADSNVSSSSVGSFLKMGAKATGSQQNAHVADTPEQKLVTGKPPLPKQPPRALVSQPPPQTPHGAGPHAHYDQPATMLTNQHQQPSSQFYVDFLDAERSFYYDDFKNQLNSGMQANGCAGAPPGSEYASPSRASVSQKTQMFNNIISARDAHQNNFDNVSGNSHKIGLIETNLDTHETVISGKTRSLMDIGPQQYGPSGKRLTAARDSDVDDIDIDGMGGGGDGVDGEGSVMIKSSGQTAGQIASVRRPHKSMEFLLDKENQKNVLTTVPIIPVKPPVQHEGCGYRNSEGVGFKIIGDQHNEAQFGEFPWMVAILRMEWASGKTYMVYVSGGALIAPTVVLTGGHGVNNRQTDPMIVRAGEWDTQTTRESLPHQDRLVKKIIVHENFDNGTLFNDIALVFMDTPFHWDENVRPICLPESNAIFDYSRCFATGWGKDEFGREGTFQVILKKVDLPVVPREQCQSNLRDTRLGKYFRLDPSFICAGGEKDKDTCQGDGGSPLVCPVPGEEGRYYQAGIVAWGIGCGEENVPGVYANVPYLRQWLNEKLNQNGIDFSHFTP